MPPDQLAWFAAQSRHFLLAKGEILSHYGEPVLEARVIISGRLELYAVKGTGRHLLNTFHRKYTKCAATTAVPRSSSKTCGPGW